MFGGTSSVAIELYQRGQPKDYDAWAARLKDHSWGWKNVLPFFKRSEKLEDKEIANSPYKKYHGFDGSFVISKDPRDMGIYDFLAAHKEMGNNILVDVAGNGSLGYGKALLTIGKEYKSSSAYAFLRLSKCRKNLHVLKGTLATKIILDAKKIARGVEAVSSDNQFFIFRARREVIISAGPVNSPQLLMLSGIGPKEHLKEMDIEPVIDLPVGKNLHDHITTVVTFALDKDSCEYEEPFNETVDPRMYTAPVYIGRVSIDKCRDNLDYTTINYLAPASLILDFCIFYYRYECDICQNIYKAIETKRSLFSLITLPYPNSRGTVTLRSKDPRVAPVIDPGYYSDKQDLKNMIKSIKNFIEIRNSTFFRKMNAELLDPSYPRCKSKVGDEYWECYLLSMMKPMSQLGGTCAMGSVVDTKLRVLGAQRLRVVDGSIMPTITSDDTVAPTVMIAEKAYDMIVEDAS